MLRTLRACILVLIALTPLFNIGEVVAFTTGGLAGQTVISTPLWIKLIKDAGTLLICGLSGVLFVRRVLRDRRVHPILWAYVPLAVVVALTIPYSIVFSENSRAAGNEVFTLAGLRWVLPIFLSFLLVDTLDEDFMRRLAVVCAAVFLLSLAVQVYQLFNATTWFGRNALGLVGRVSGVFLLPATSGFFACVVAFLGWFYLRRSVMRYVLMVLAPLSIFFSASISAIVIYVLLLLLVSFGGRGVKFKLSLLPMLAVLGFLTLGTITNRPDVFDVSGAVRMRHVVRSLVNAEPLSDRFGFGTNSAVLIDTTFRRNMFPEVLDSTYATVLVNTGLAGALAHVFLLACGAILVARSRRLDGFVFMLMYLVAGLSQPFTESFPMNLLFAVWIGYFVPQAWQPQFGLTGHFLSLFGAAKPAPVAAGAGVPAQ